MHIQQGGFGADIEPVYDRATYVLKHYAYVILDNSKGHKELFRGTAKDLKAATAAAEKHLRKLLEENRLNGPKAA
ncbi:MAG TPA: hypothetical protein VFI95_10505 [Terriglobales bacterium]|nr:hypothetical protein [Terriglobales bacterium]